MERPKIIAMTAAMMLANMTAETPDLPYREVERAKLPQVKKPSRAKIKAARKQRRYHQ